VLAPVWFCFASSSVFRNTEPTQLEPLWFIPVPPQLREQVKFDFECVYSRSFPKLPEVATFRSSGKDFFWSRELGLVENFWPPPFNRGFTQAVFRVTSFSKWNGLQLPTAASYEQFGLITASIGLVKLYSLDISATNFERLPTELTFVPSLNEKTLIRDNRLASAPLSAVYMHSNWPSVKDPVVKYAFKKAGEAFRASKHKFDERRSTLFVTKLSYGVVLLLACAFVVAKLRSQRKCTTSHMQNKSIIALCSVAALGIVSVYSACHEYTVSTSFSPGQAEACAGLSVGAACDFYMFVPPILSCSSRPEPTGATCQMAGTRDTQWNHFVGTCGYAVQGDPNSFTCGGGYGGGGSWQGWQTMYDLEMWEAVEDPNCGQR